MSKKTRVLLCALWIAHPVIQTVIAVVMVRRGQHTAPSSIFSLASSPKSVAFAVVFPAYLYNHSACFYLSWFSTAISVALGFQVIHAALSRRVQTFPHVRDLGTVLFKWAGFEQCYWSPA